MPTVSETIDATEITKPAVEIIPNLDLSSFPHRLDPKYTHVLNMCMTPNNPTSNQPEILHLQLLDWDDITPYIPQIVQFIDSALQHPQNRVLVHCALGVNRSASAVTAYLCHRNGSDSTAALGYVKSKKPDVTPAVIFLHQIDRYFGREDASRKDPMVAFHERLLRRKAGIVAEDGNCQLGD